MFNISRNDPCWCGSGKKFKKCHVDTSEKLDKLRLEGYEMPPKSIFRTPEQIEGIKKSCNLTHSILIALNDFIKVGVTTEEINTFVHDTTLAAGAIPAPLNYRGFPKSCCTSLNEVICHGIPEDRALIEGDIINVDVTCILNGYYGDSCRMYTVGEVSKKAQKLIDVTYDCLHEGIKAVKPFLSTNVIGDAIEATAKKHGYGIVEMFGGHGLGLEFHEEPFIYHYARTDKQMIMLPGMTFTIEPMINEGTHKGKILKDGWTAVTKDGKLSAQWEHTILVTPTGADILT
jgi:methionyl aminopeptidase